MSLTQFDPTEMADKIPRIFHNEGTSFFFHIKAQPIASDTTEIRESGGGGCGLWLQRMCNCVEYIKAEVDSQL